jgi:hypothetical protein
VWRISRDGSVVEPFAFLPPDGLPNYLAFDRQGNLYPAKQRPEQKIDAAVALMMAVGRAMAEDANEGDLQDFLRNPVIA